MVLDEFKRGTQRKIPYKQHGLWSAIRRPPENPHRYRWRWWTSRRWSYWQLSLPVYASFIRLNRINTKLGSDGRLTLSGRLLKQLYSTSFSWHVKALFFLSFSIWRTFLFINWFFLCICQHRKSLSLTNLGFSLSRLALLISKYYCSGRLIEADQ